MKKLFSLLLIFVSCFSFLTPSFAYDTTNKNQGKVALSSKVDTSIPKRFKPSNNKDIKYRLEVLPFEKHRYHNQYIVIPDMGLVAPMVELDPKSDDYKKGLKGTFDYNKYLVGWPVIYPGTATIGKVGNTFLFGHSNYRHNKEWDFKTIFRLTYNLQEGDPIRVYKKFDGKWVFFEYKVTISQKIWAKDTWALLPEKGKTTLTLLSCWPIGTATARRMNRAELVTMEELDKVLGPPAPPPTIKKAKRIKK
jgi:LPXTG-site transpeptidase (sortase) family protein